MRRDILKRAICDLRGRGGTKGEYHNVSSACLCCRTLSAAKLSTCFSTIDRSWSASHQAAGFTALISLRDVDVVAPNDQLPRLKGCLRVPRFLPAAPLTSMQLIARALSESVIMPHKLLRYARNTLRNFIHQANMQKRTTYNTNRVETIIIAHANIACIHCQAFSFLSINTAFSVIRLHLLLTYL